MNRGNKLWEGSRMILPEHRAAMIEQSINEEKLFPRPELDEDKLMEMSETLGAAIAEGRLVIVQVHERFGPRSVSMLPKWIDQANRRLVGLSQLGEEKVRVLLVDIIDINAE